MTVENYTPAIAAQWDDAVKASRNGTFIHLRQYMDYHSDRFADHSLVARDDKGRIIAVLPAHLHDNQLCSHKGLTFGGWLMTARADMPAMMQVWRLMEDKLRSEGVKSLIYKPVPHIYHSSPAEEDIYAAWRSGARLLTVMPASAIDLSGTAGFDMAARQGVRKAEKAGITVAQSDRWHDFWQVLKERLESRYNAVPVHSIDEILLLKNRFPDNIKLYTAELDGEILSGAVIYINNGTAAHSQYTASTDKGLKMRSLALLYHTIATELRGQVRYLDYGTSCEDGGKVLNEGLIRQKCSYGARAVAYTTLSIEL